MGKNTVATNRFAGRDKRLRSLEDYAEGLAIIDVGATAIATSQTSATWYRTAANRMAMGTPALSTSGKVWCIPVLAAAGAAIDVNTFALAPGKYKVTMNLRVNAGAATDGQYRYALTDDGTDNLGDGGEAALISNGTVHIEFGADADDAAETSRIGILDLDVATGGYSTDAVAGDEVQGYHLLYFCAANNAAGSMAHAQSGVSQIVIERIG